jgi:hypothetical protein
MGRPRGRTKTARLTVNLEPREYDALRTLAREQDVPIAWLIRRSVKAFLTLCTVGDSAHTTEKDHKPRSAEALR